MTVAIHNHANLRRLRLQIKPAQIMQHIDRYATKIDHFSLGQFVRSRFSVDISANGGHRRELRERCEYPRIPDVPDMQYVIGITERLDGLWPKQTMRIRYDADNHW